MISDNAQSHIFAKRSAPRLMAFGQRTLLVVSTGRFAAGVIARSHGRLSARILGDSPISASLPPNSLPVLRKSPIIPPVPPRLDRSLLPIAIDNFPAFSRVCDQQTAADVAQMKDQMVAVDQAARQDPLSSSGRYRRSARWQMRQAKPAMLTEVDMHTAAPKPLPEPK
jgi:hypothetical protein